MLFTIPWRHHVEIFTHAKSADEALFYGFLGVSEYKLTKLLLQDFKSSLPSVKDIEAQLAEKSHVEQKHKKRSKARHAKHTADAERQIADAKKGTRP